MYSKLSRLALLLAGVSLAAGCVDDEILNTPRRAGGDLFARYVSLGNSITAGFQSGGINDSTQLQSYPNLLAQQAGAGFGLPLLARPGCPPPFLAPLGTTGRVRTGLPTGAPAPTESTCALRTNTAPITIQNLAVPGALINSASTNTVAANALTTFVLGGRTQIQAMVAAQPTLVSAWLGNNDALGVIGGRGTPGQPGFIPPGDLAALSSLADFNRGLDSLIAGIEQTPAAQNDAVVLIGTVKPTVAPILQPGAYFFSIPASARGNKPVNANCAPGTPGGNSLVSFAIVSSALPEINCAGTTPFVLDVAEVAAVNARVDQFNAAMQSRAQSNGYIYVDPNVLLTSVANQTNASGQYNRLRGCQELKALLAGPATGLTPTAIGAAITRSCPNTAAPNFFGSLISFDGVHPAVEGHQIVANEIATRLNTQFSLQIPLVTVPAIR